MSEEPGSGELTFWLDERRVTLRDVPGTLTLLRWLREQAGQTGTKEGCGEGDCGACTVAVLETSASGPARWRAVNSCLLFLPMLQGKRVVTVEALREPGASMKPGGTGLHPAQQAMVESRGSQCGYCTPGIVMSLFESVYRDDMGEAWQVDDQLCGNLCRCTGYRPIREAGLAVAGLQPSDRFAAEAKHATHRSAALSLSGSVPVHGGQRWLQPASLAELYALREAYPDAPLIAGGTDLGLRVTKRHEHLPVVIGLEALDELVGVQAESGGWRVGARTTLTQLMAEVGAEIPALHEMLRWFGSRQIRNRATLGGNLMNASPIGDMAPVMVALGATAELVGPKGRRAVPMNAFFVGYRQTAAEADELLASIYVPRPTPGAQIASYKVSKRREMDISTVAGAFWVDVREGQVQEVRLAFGGMGPIAGQRAAAAEAVLRGSAWTSQAIEQAAEALDGDFTPMSDARGSAKYRAALAGNLLRKFFFETQGGAA